MHARIICIHFIIRGGPAHKEALNPRRREKAHKNDSNANYRELFASGRRAHELDLQNNKGTAFVFVNIIVNICTTTTAGIRLRRKKKKTK